MTILTEQPWEAGPPAAQDHDGAPIFWCVNAGACWTGNDRLGAWQVLTAGAAQHHAAPASPPRRRLPARILVGLALAVAAVSLAACQAAATAPARPAPSRSAALPRYVIRDPYAAVNKRLTAEQRRVARQYVKGLCAGKNPAPAALRPATLARVCHDWGFKVAPSRARTTANSAAPVILCAAGVSPACFAYQDTNTTGGGCIQDFLLLDHNGSPIWWVNDCGGMWVGNDKNGVTGASVFDQAIYMSVPDGVHGALTIDGSPLTAADVRYLLSVEPLLTVNDVKFLVCVNKGGTVAACRNGG